MDLSVIIVNYNVKEFLGHCLHAVNKAIRGIEAEVFVVDNNSVDGSCAMIKKDHPSVKLIPNTHNLGFSKANNQAIKSASGRYVLLLNPDTVVEENCFRKCLGFMDQHPDAGALGIKMIDGNGKFLPESKRSLPTPLVAFYKIFGLSSLFPRSRIFGKYHLGYLSPDDIHEVDILSGAFMLIRKSVLDKTGLLDENFFMYGEDIDLSRRIQKAGYKNYYYPETTIIHYKGESTKKSSINYVLIFYNAMIIFARKHFSPRKARIFSVLINSAVYFIAGLSILKRFFLKIYQAALDGLLIFLGFRLIAPFWENLVFGSGNHFPETLYTRVVPAYIAIMLVSLYYSGGYEKPVRIWNLLKGFSAGILINLIIYALLPESLRFSRAILLLGSLWTLIALLIHRLIFALSGLSDNGFALSIKRKILIIGGNEEAARVGDLMEHEGLKPEIVGYVDPTSTPDALSLGRLGQLKEIIDVHRINELIFCSKDVTSSEIIHQMGLLSATPVECKIAPPGSSVIIGSRAAHYASGLYLIEFTSIASERNRRRKRRFDVIASIALLLLSPVMALFIRDIHKIAGSCIQVLTGKATWIGYCNAPDNSLLPLIRKGIFSLTAGQGKNDPDFYERLNAEYAGNYRISADAYLLWRNLAEKKRKL
jgi:GT2 family glycosyltransferase